MAKQISSQYASVSVIVPVDNAKTYLGNCLESLISQTLSEIEIILVDCRSTDGSYEECVEYAKKDPRISSYKKDFSTMGEACNFGIRISEGEYIAFVDPRDWTEAEMYSELYGQAKKQDADVVKSLFYIETGNGEPLMDRSINNNPIWFKTKIKDILVVPGFYLNKQSVWAAIYRKEFLSKHDITFNETKDICESTSLFNFLVFCSRPTLIICQAAYYHYNQKLRTDSHPEYSHALNTLNVHSLIQSEIKKRQTDKTFSLIEMAKLMHDIEEQLRTNCTTVKSKTEYLRQSHNLLKNYMPLLDKNTYLNEKEKKLYINMVSKPEKTAPLIAKSENKSISRSLLSIQFKREVSYIRILYFPLLFIKKTENYRTFNVCGIPIKRVKKTIYADSKTVKTKYYYLYLPLIKRMETRAQIKTYVLGVMVYKKINLLAQMTDIVDRINKMPSLSDIVFYSGILNTVASVHSKVFPQFKNSNTGKSVAIFGSGPSLIKSPKIADCRTIACNKAIEFFENRDPDYFFAVDCFSVMDFYDRIEKLTSCIFLGHIIEPRNYPRTIPEVSYLKDNVYPYYESPPFDFIRPELEQFPIFNSCTIVNSAMHFALYTNPNTIYLLGCDNTNNGFFIKNIASVTEEETYHKMLDGYKLLKNFRDVFYPNTRIISVNPIGLRGLFEDVYTEAFLNENPDIDKANVTVIEKI